MIALYTYVYGFGCINLVGKSLDVSNLPTAAMTVTYLKIAVYGDSGCSAAWLARLTGGQEVVGSNPTSPIVAL